MPPTRRRPGATSPIARLEPHVEQVKTPTTVEVQPAPELEPVVAEQAPAPAVETSTEAEPTTNAPRARRTAKAKAQPSTPAALEPAPVTGPEERKAITFQMRTSLKKRVETAILRTQGLPGGYHSLAAFMDGAATRELERLEKEFNNGEPYSPNPGQFRTGRPIG